MSLLKQAIVDAANLKEAALKNAEQMILEKYSNEIKSAVDTLLEVEDDGGLDLGGETAATEPTDEENSEPSTFEEENIIPPSYMEGEQITSKDGEMEFTTPDEGETIDINISPEELAQFLRDAEQNDVGQYVDPRLDDFQAQMDDEQVEIDLSQLADLSDAEELGYDDGEEEIELPDDLEGMERMVAEALSVDYTPQPHGQIGGASEVDYEAAIDMALAKAMSDEMQEENEDLQDTLGELQEELASLKEQNKKFKSVTLQLKDKLEESIITNAKLLYSNRVLISTSLNERQKSKIVEALNKAHTVGEAKTIYETLQSTVKENTSSPQTLSEAINRNAGRSSTLPRRTPQKESLNEGAASRWKMLAGIK
tara:strand:+ start:2546 stop:3649 length:1104 start_codon:yes stop_codon:yes gene_type:complete